MANYLFGLDTIINKADIIIIRANAHLIFNKTYKLYKNGD